MGCCKNPPKLVPDLHQEICWCEWHTSALVTGLGLSDTRVNLAPTMLCANLYFVFRIRHQRSIEMKSSLCSATLTGSICRDAVVSEQVTNPAQLQDGCFPETLLCSMLWSFNDKMINFSKQNKDTPLYLENKCKVAAKPEVCKEICAHCAQISLLEMAIKPQFLFLFGLMPSQGWHQGWIWLFALFSLGMWEQNDAAYCGAKAKTYRESEKIYISLLHQVHQMTSAYDIALHY